MQSIPNILILGGGYGGFRIAVYLQKHLPSSLANVTLISKHDYHYQTTLLHKVAVGTYSARKARIFFRKILDSKKVSFIKDTILTIDPESRRVFGERNCYSYDYLIIALGFNPNTFSIKGVDEFCYKLSSLNAAIRLRGNIETKFKDFDNQDPLDLHFIVCGSGFTGIEFAAELGTQINELCAICGIDKSLVDITCISRTDRILPMFKPKDSEIAKEKLDKLGIKFLQGDVIECKKNAVILKTTNQIHEVKANNIIWCAGVKGSRVVENSPSFKSKNSRILVDEFLAVREFNNVFVVGDCAVQERNILNAPTAQLANQMGEYVAKNLIKILTHKPIDKAFVFKHRGTVCSIGHTDGVGVVFNVSIRGELAAFLKNVIENKWIFCISGLGNVLKKGQFRFRSSN